jgi:glycosyltransferase involved in cell wall biosynthesis
MKLLFCCENYPPSVGGVQEVVRQIAERLAAKGHQVTVATSAHADRAADCVRNGVRVVSFAIAGNRVRGMRGPVQAYQKFVVQGGFDAVCIKAAQQWTFDALVDALPDIRARKVFIPCGFSGLYQRSYRSYFAEMPSWLARFDALIFYASNYRDIRFARDHGLQNLHVLPNGADEREFLEPVDPGLRTRLGVAESDYLLLTVGSINGAKGHWEVARAFELSKLDRPALLLLNGNVPSRSAMGLLRQWLLELLKGRTSLAALVRRINGTPDGNKRVLLTDLSRADVVQAFKACDLFVFASHVEYSPLVLFEAAAAGKPFLTTPAGNAEEIVQWTGGGVVCPSARLPNGLLQPDPQELARAIERLMSDPEQRSRLGKSGRQAFLESGLSWARIADRYEQVLMGDSPETVRGSRIG